MHNKTELNFDHFVYISLLVDRKQKRLKTGGDKGGGYPPEETSDDSASGNSIQSALGGVSFDQSVIAEVQGVSAFSFPN